MTLSEQCCTREQGERLVLLGVTAPAIFYHMPEKSHLHGEFIRYGWHSDAVAPAYTVAELGEMLPSSVKYMGKWQELIHIKSNVPNEDGLELLDYTSGYLPDRAERLDIGAGGSNEAESRADLLICLLQNKIIEPCQITNTKG